MYKRIKKWYDSGLWTADMVRNAAAKGVITEDQAASIIGEGE